MLVLDARTRSRRCWCRRWSDRTPRRPSARPALSIVDWARRRRSVRARRRLHPRGRDDGHLGLRLGAAPARDCSDAVPGSSYRSLTQTPADAPGGQGRQRARPAGGGGRRRRRHVRADPGCPVRRPEGDRRRGRPGAACCASSGTSRSTSRWSAPGRTAPTRTTRPATADDRGRRRRRARLRRPDERLRLGHQPHGVRRRAVRRGPRGARDRAAGTAGGVDAVRPGVACQEIDRAARAR